MGVVMAALVTIAVVGFIAGPILGFMFGYYPHDRGLGGLVASIAVGLVFLGMGGLLAICLGALWAEALT